MANSWSGVADGARRRIVASKWGQPRLLVELTLGGALVVGGAVGAVAWQRQATQQQPVVVAARDLRRGDTVSLADLRVASLVGAQGVRTMSTAEAADLVGGTLTVDVAEAAPLSPHAVEQRTRPGAGQALVAVALRPGEAPPDVAPLDHVQVVTVRLDPLGSAPPDITYDWGEVWAVRPATDLDTTTVITLRAQRDVLERVALADRVRLGVIAP